MIDKNIRLEPHHSRDLLVGRRSNGRRPKYQPPGHGTGGGRGRDPGPSGPPGGGDRQMTYSAPAPTPAPTRSRQAAVDQAAIDKAATERALQTIISGKEKQQAESERMSNLAEARRKMTQPATINLPDARTIQPIGQIDPYQQSYIIPYGKGDIRTKTASKYQTPATQNYQNIFQTGAVSQTPGGAYQPSTPAGTGEGLGSIDVEDVGFQNALRKQQIRKDDIAAQQDPNYGQFFRPQPVVEKPKFFDTGMGKFAKGAGKIALTGLTAGAGAGLFGKDIASLAKAAQWGKRAYDFKQGKGIYGALKSNLTSTIDKAKAAKFRDERTTLGKQDIEDWERKQDWSGIKPDVGGGGDGQGGTQAQVPKDVVTASIQEFSPEQADMMKQRYSQLQGVLDSGVYQGRQLTAEEIQMLQQKSLEIQKLMEQYLVDPEELGLARGGIASIYG